MTSPYTLPAVLNPPLTGREGVADALYRCVTAFDTNDTAMFDSSYLPDGVLEINGRPMKGLPEIHSTGLALVFSVDTTHLVTNVRVHMKKGTTSAGTEEENEASLTATVLSQHFAGGKGLEPDQKNLLGGSLYHGDLTKDVNGLWKIKYLQIKSIWIQGDYSVIGGKFNEE